jgi:hypothetical protein
VVANPHGAGLGGNQASCPRVDKGEAGTPRVNLVRRVMQLGVLWHGTSTSRVRHEIETTHFQAVAVKHNLTQYREIFKASGTKSPSHLEISSIRRRLLRSWDFPGPHEYMKKMLYFSVRLVSNLTLSTPRVRGLRMRKKIVKRGG